MVIPAARLAAILLPIVRGVRHVDEGRPRLCKWKHVARDSVAAAAPLPYVLAPAGRPLHCLRQQYVMLMKSPDYPAMPLPPTPQIEQFQSLVELKKYDAAGEIPFRAIVRAMPNLKDKQTFLKDMDEQAARNAQAEQGTQALRLRGAAAKVAETESKAALNVAKATEAPNESAAN